MKGLTEGEAQKKWCPYRNRVRFIDGTTPHFTNDEAEKCVGSTCMMWRWLVIYNKTDGESYGYCGVGGKP